MFSLSRILFFSVMAICFVFVLSDVSGNTINTQRPVKRREWTKAAKVWTARSCVGEAGFDAVDECMAIAWVYATRATETKSGYLEVVKKYSAAIKRHSTHRRPWILQLDETMEKPQDWPNLKWRVHRHLWRKILTGLDEWAKGRVPNPIPKANHYGSEDDAKRARYVKRWKKLPAPPEFRNWFFDSREIQRKSKIDWSEVNYWRTVYWPDSKNTDKRDLLLRKGEFRYGNLIIDKRRNLR